MTWWHHSGKRLAVSSKAQTQLPYNPATSRSQAGEDRGLLCNGAVSDLQDEKVLKIFHDVNICARNMVKMVKFVLRFLPQYKNKKFTELDS